MNIDSYHQENQQVDKIFKAIQKWAPKELCHIQVKFCSQFENLDITKETSPDEDSLIELRRDSSSA